MYAYGWEKLVSDPFWTSVSVSKIVFDTLKPPTPAGTGGLTVYPIWFSRLTTSPAESVPK